MGDPHVISALMKKRAELAGELKRARAETAKIQADMLRVDRVIRMFDPTLVPEKVTPIMRRGSSVFGGGELTRAIFNMLRSGKPMSLREIATQLAAMHGLDINDRAVAASLIKKAHRVVSKRRGDLIVREMRDRTAIWRIKV